MWFCRFTKKDDTTETSLVIILCKLHAGIILHRLSSSLEEIMPIRINWPCSSGAGTHCRIRQRNSPRPQSLQAYSLGRVHNQGDRSPPEMVFARVVLFCTCISNFCLRLLWRWLCRQVSTVTSIFTQKMYFLISNMPMMLSPHNDARRS